MLNFAVELSRSNELLERIAIALERAVGPVILPTEVQKLKLGTSRVVTYGNEGDQWAIESIKKQIKNLGASPEETEEMTQQAIAQYKENRRLVHESGGQDEEEEEGVRFL